MRADQKWLIKCYILTATLCNRARLRELRSGDDDMALVYFLMTLQSTGEVAEYISHFLGQTSAVSQFSAEFIKCADRKFWVCMILLVGQSVP